MFSIFCYFCMSIQVSINQSPYYTTRDIYKWSIHSYTEIKGDYDMQYYSVFYRLNIEENYQHSSKNVLGSKQQHSSDVSSADLACKLNAFKTWLLSLLAVNLEQIFHLSVPLSSTCIVRLITATTQLLRSLNEFT